MNSRDEIILLLHGNALSRLPVFGVLPALTARGLRAENVRYNETHTDADKMARAASSTFELFGFESAVVPFDLCVEAEALGCAVDFQTDIDAFIAPTIESRITNYDFSFPEVARAGRIPLVADAIRKLKTRVGEKIAVGAFITGPYTLGWQLFGAEKWFEFVGAGLVPARRLQNFAEWLARIGNYYRDAGADFITVHEMGGSPQVIGAARFREVVKPALQNLFARLKSPRVLSVCGDTNAVVRDLAECGANAINVDHKNNLARTRRELPNAILLGNYDPVGLLSRGSVEDIARAVEKIAQDGADAIVAGCDLYPEIPHENFRTLVASSHSLVVK
ncbi:MAG: hypothetical protein HY070_05940 [Chloroflexi bacterium]|nr:hypothetical protein [Chloroflexota bacterium]